MKPTRVLIVEDEMIFALDLAQRLESAGYEICELTSKGDKAISNCERQRPDIVLIDINLRGGSSGIQTAREIRTRFSIPVVFMTGYADEKTRTEAEIAGPAGFLIKPFEIPELLHTIESAVGKSGQPG